MRGNLWSLRRSHTWNLTYNYSYKRLDHFGEGYFVLWCMRTCLAKFLVRFLFYYNPCNYYSIFTCLILFWNLAVLLASAITCSRRLHSLIAVRWKGFYVTRLMFQPFIFIQSPCVLLSWKRVLSKTPSNFSELLISFCHFSDCHFQRKIVPVFLFFPLLQLCFSLHNLSIYWFFFLSHDDQRNWYGNCLWLSLVKKPSAMYCCE